MCIYMHHNYNCTVIALNYLVCILFVFVIVNYDKGNNGIGMVTVCDISWELDIICPSLYHGKYYEENYRIKFSDLIGKTFRRRWSRNSD